jgi:leucyl-tRNA synthetase
VRELERTVHKTIRRVTDDVERFKFNTALAALMELTNSLTQQWELATVDSGGWKNAVEKLLLLMAPMAPHMAEELWESTGHSFSIHQQSWPKWDADLAADEVITLVVQVNGRLRDRIQVSASVTEDEAKEVALHSERVQSYTTDKSIVRVIYVPGKLINIVAR